MGAAKMRMTLFYKHIVRNSLESGTVARSFQRDTRRLHHSVISRFVDLDRPEKNVPSYDRVLEILKATNVERTRSFIAAELLHRPDLYDHPGVCLLADILPDLARSLTAPNSAVVEHFNSRESRTSFERVAEVIQRLGLAKSALHRKFSDTLSRF